jgi:biofilm PGA synthesis N-glycosyltransferase PgaC
MNVSIVIPAHNEARNIQNVLESLLAQETEVARITEIVVIASGCTDDTAGLARAKAKGRPGVHVVVQERRAGKVAAINAYLAVRDTRAEVVMMCSADLVVAPDVVERIAQCLHAEPDVGMVGARPVPDNDPNTMMGRMVSLLWELHHRVALDEPKMGELVAFRADLVDHVSELSIVDEASVEDIVRRKGYRLAYVGDAVVHNHGPEQLKEYFEQRRRIARGHYWLSFAFGYDVATMKKGSVLRRTAELFAEQDLLGKQALVAAVGVEVAARAVGFVDARIIGGRHRTWTPLVSTKNIGVKAENLPPASVREPRGQRDPRDERDRAPSSTRNVGGPPSPRAVAAPPSTRAAQGAR